eukprot:Seg5321.1 transcript_id=Seg5321.1/GoldUCD/mRNA.D3Y31 product="hypothetical protein" protein_id=Seg5321.1/GoldUCD/D3Y31
MLMFCTRCSRNIAFADNRELVINESRTNTEMALFNNHASSKLAILVTLSFIVLCLLNRSTDGKPVPRPSSCHQRCHGEYRSCETLAESVDLHTLCVLAKDLCRGSCRRRLQRTAFGLKDVKYAMSMLSAEISELNKSLATTAGTTKRPYTGRPELGLVTDSD